MQVNNNTLAAVSVWLKHQKHSLPLETLNKKKRSLEKNFWVVIPPYHTSHLQITAEKTVAERSTSKLGDVSCHCKALLWQRSRGSFQVRRLLGVDISVCLPPTTSPVLSKHCQQQWEVDRLRVMLFEAWHCQVFDPAKQFYFYICPHAILQLSLSSCCLVLLIICFIFSTAARLT